MKRINRFFALAVCSAVAFTACYDDADLQKRMGDAETEISNLKTAVAGINSDLSSLKTLTQKLDSKVTVDKVETTSNGYTIHFSDNTTATIQNGADGKNGKDGYTPAISIAKYTDGKYYWTLDSAWLKDATGAMIPAQGENGTPGAPGANGNDGITPQVKVEGDYWYVSTDKGATWQKMGIASSAEINTVFKGVEETPSQVIFTLNDGSTIAIAKTTGFSFSIDPSSKSYSLEQYTYSDGETDEVLGVSFKYSITGADDKTEIGVISGGMNPYTVTKTSDTEGIIKILTERYTGYVYNVFVYASNESTSVIRAITLGEDFTEVVVPEEGVVVDEEGGNVVFSVYSSQENEVVIPEDAQSWLSYVATKGVVEYNKAYLIAQPNTSTQPRSTVIKYGDKEITVVQKGVLDPAKGVQAKYLGNTMNVIYDNEVGGFTHNYGEYYVEVPAGTDLLKLAVNVTVPEEPLAAFPTGTFSFDAGGVHTDKTFTAKGSQEKLYTAVVSGEKELEIVEGTVTISEDNGLYTITATLTDADEVSHNYSTVTGISVKDASYGVASVSANFKGEYDTYFESDANAWEISILASGMPDENSVEIANLSLVLYGQTGYVSDEEAKELPTGRFQFAIPEEKGGTGHTDAKPYSFGFLGTTYGSWMESNYFIAKDGYLLVEKNEDGTYYFNYELVGDVQGYNEDFTEFITKRSNVVYSGSFTLPIDVVTGSYLRPTPDGDIELPEPMNSTYQWYGHPYEADGVKSNVFVLSLTGYTYTLTLPICADASWEFVGNGVRDTYCINHIPNGVYPVELGPAPKEQCIANISKNAYRCKYTNSYTGTVFSPESGSITIEDDSIILNLEMASTDGKTAKVTGTLTYGTLYGIQKMDTKQTNVPWKK